MSTILTRLTCAVRSAADPEVLVCLERRLADAERECAQAVSRAALAMKHKLEYFDLLERVMRQRDEWQSMFRAGEQKFQTALAMMENQLIHERLVTKKVVEMLNEMRVKAGMPLLKHKAELPRLDAFPIGLADKHAKELLELLRSGDLDSRRERAARKQPLDRPADIDVLAERGALEKAQNAKS